MKHEDSTAAIIAPAATEPVAVPEAISLDQFYNAAVGSTGVELLRVFCLRMQHEGHLLAPHAEWQGRLAAFGATPAE